MTPHKFHIFLNKTHEIEIYLVLMLFEEFAVGPAGVFYSPKYRLISSFNDLCFNFTDESLFRLLLKNEFCKSNL